MCNPQMGEFEPAFVGRMIQESTAFKTKAGAVSRRTIDMAQGQKRSRIVAWTFRGELGAKSGKKDGGAS
ncbi:MAG: RlmF-related methyltransferase [Elusimicrobia bacterium]|nr:RlmF-related methyltransferase [Elusimicrobiota bacterium]